MVDRSSFPVALWALLTATGAATACNSLAGLGTLGFGGAGGQGGTESDGGSASQGGAGGGSGGDGGDAPTAGGGGSGGRALSCEAITLGVTDVCPEGSKCTVIDPARGTVGCGLAGSQGSWETCTDDTDCADGLWCDLERHVCKPFCLNMDDCSEFDGACVPAARDDGAPISNDIKTCIAMCNPLTAAPCGTATTCAFIFNNQFDCAQSQNFTLGTTCTVQADCGRTLGCISSIGASCEQYCAPIGSSHPNCSFECLSIGNPAVTFQGQEIGTCF